MAQEIRDMEIRKILVPIDFSEQSQRALDEAIGFAKHFGAELILFHCYPVPIPPLGGVPYHTIAPAAYVEAIRAAALESLTRWGDKTRAEGVRVQEQIGTGSPSGAIAAAAEEVGADLIVMGTRGLSCLEHVMLGSVAERTIRLARCPVLTIK